MENKNLTQQELEVANGGLEEENDEITAFIRSHDPGFKIRNPFDIMRWLTNKSGIGFKSLSASEIRYNEYTLSDGSTISHEQLMEMLKEKFPG